MARWSVLLERATGKRICSTLVQASIQTGKVSEQEAQVGTWKSPASEVWHTIRCSKCSKQISKQKLPGLVRQVAYRVCSTCGPQGGGPPRGEARRTPRPPQATS